MLKLLLYAVAKAIGHTALILVEGLIQSDVGGSQAGVTLGHDVVRAEHAAERNRAHGYCRCIDFRQLQTGLHIGRGQVLLVIVLGVGSAFLQDHFTAIDLFLGLMDGLHHLVMILQNILSLHSRLAGRDGRCYAHNSSTKDHDGRACFLQLIAMLRGSPGHSCHELLGFHVFQKLHKISVLSISAAVQCAAESVGIRRGYL